MLTILPMEDREREKSLLDGLSEKTEDNARVLMMSDGKEELGWVAVKIVHSVLRMLHMEVPGAQPEALTGESVFIADSLMRAAASYGAAVGAYKIRSLEPAWNEFLRLRGFTPGETGAETDLSTIVKYTGPKFPDTTANC